MSALRLIGVVMGLGLWVLLWAAASDFGGGPAWWVLTAFVVPAWLVLVWWSTAKADE